jgi:RNA 3'-terminal phosphate cyclase (ATP)
MVRIDGSKGEGGGQVLRTSLALSLVTGTPFQMVNIRAGRSKPGLLRQHLTAVKAATAVGHAEVTGAELHSKELTFRPRGVTPGDYQFAVGTAGSATLVLQTVLPALLAAPAPSSLLLEGGTHNPLAPCADFVLHTFAPALRTMGASLDLQLLRHGFAPAGGGAIAANIGPSRLAPTTWLRRTPAGLPRARALVAQLPTSIGERELAIVQRRLGSVFHREQMAVESVDSYGPGNILLLEFPLEGWTEVIGVPGERGVSAEHVANTACGLARTFLAVEAPVGEHLADQLLLPLALAGGGALRTLPPSLHTRTNAQVIERFLPVRFTFRDEPDRSCVIEVAAR